MPQDEARLELRIDIWLQNVPATSSGIQLRQTLELKTRDFMKMCQILAQFEQLAEKLKAES